MCMPITAHNPFKGRHYPGEVIVLCVRWYLCYPLSYEHVSELMAERGVEVTVRFCDPDAGRFVSIPKTLIGLASSARPENREDGSRRDPEGQVVEDGVSAVTKGRTRSRREDRRAALHQAARLPPPGATRNRLKLDTSGSSIPGDGSVGSLGPPESLRMES